MLQYEIKCELPDHTSKKSDATHSVTVDWAFTMDEATKKKRRWEKRGVTKVLPLNRAPRVAQ